MACFPLYARRPRDLHGGVGGTFCAWQRPGVHRPCFKVVLFGLGIAHPPRWLPRPREPGLHRVLVLKALRALGRAARDPRPGPGGDRWPHRPLPPPAHSGLSYRTPAEVALKTCDVPSKNHNPCGLSSQHQRGAGTPNALEPRRGLSRSARCARASGAPPGSNPCGAAASRGGRAERWRS